VGGAVAGVRLVGWRGIPATVAGATVIAETVLTLLSSWVFAVLGVTLAVNFDATATDYHRVIVVLALSLPIPLILAALLGSGSLFGRLQKLLVRFIGVGDSSAGGHSLDQALHLMLRRHGNLLAAGTLQFLALLSGAVEVWFALRLFGHPVSPGAALMLESMVQAFRHLAFMVPASLGVQETVLVVFGHSVGIGPETAIAMSLVKRLREVVYGLASLASWQWMEGRRLAANEANTVMTEAAARSGDLDA